jgi:hypothetical protein
MSSNPAGSASGASITQAPSGNRSAGRSAASSMVNSTSVSIPGTAAAGGIQMVQPVSTVTTYYKIAPSDNITFKWNLTSL